MGFSPLLGVVARKPPRCHDPVTDAAWYSLRSPGIVKMTYCSTRELTTRLPAHRGLLLTVPERSGHDPADRRAPARADVLAGKMFPANSPEQGGTSTCICQGHRLRHRRLAWATIVPAYVPAHPQGSARPFQYARLPTCLELKVRRRQCRSGTARWTVSRTAADSGCSCDEPSIPAIRVPRGQRCPGRSTQPPRPFPPGWRA